MESHRRSIVKAASYRLLATSLVFLIAFLYTGELGSSVKIGFSAAVAKTTLYYLWERLWANISWGIEEPGIDAAPQSGPKTAPKGSD